MNQELLTFYQEYKDKINAYQLALNTMYFDTSTIAPKKGSAYRNKMAALLSGEVFSHMTNPESIAKIEALSKESDLDPQLKTELTLLLKDLENERHVPKDVYVAFSQTVNDSQSAWHEAKEKKDYQIFKPHLIKVIEMQKKMLSYVPKNCSDYDYLLDRYQSGMNIEKYDVFFNDVKTKLIPLIKEIQERGKKIDDSILFKNYDIKKQEEYLEVIKKFFNYNKDRLYMCTTEHPFTSFFSAHDVRLTTHYYEDNVMSAISSTAHEYGHALYGLQIDEKYEGTTIANDIGFAMHESQSRFLENHIGKNRAFWEVNYPPFKEMFKEQLSDVTLDDFMDMIGVSRPSLIRIEADELTYPLHILIRYELEKEIFNGNVDYDNLDKLWNDKYEEYLGVRPENDAEGILQDMHWGAAYLGYFPTYALGSAFAAQFYNAMSKEFDVEEALRTNNFEKVSNWQKEHIHRFGAAKTADEIILEACGEPFTSTYYTDYLVNKYRTIYNLD